MMWLRNLMKKFGGAYPTKLQKVWAELMVLAAGPLKPPLLPPPTRNGRNLPGSWSMRAGRRD
jgi:hypothetical protein